MFLLYEWHLALQGLSPIDEKPVRYEESEDSEDSPTRLANVRFFQKGREKRAKPPTIIGGSEKKINVPETVE